jgi:hypothetical protein
MSFEIFMAVNIFFCGLQHCVVPQFSMFMVEVYPEDGGSSLIKIFSNYLLDSML